LMHKYRLVFFAGAVFPKTVYRIAFPRLQFEATARGLVADGIKACEGVQGGIIADDGAFFGVRSEIGRNCHLRREFDGVEVPVHLRLRLERIAAIRKKYGLVLKDDCAASRAGEACEPGEAVRIGRNTFVLKLVRLRNDEAIEAGGAQVHAQSAETAGSF